MHLLDYTRFSEALEVPPEMSQDGLASAADVELRHLTQYLRPLMNEELVRERTVHVKGSRQRRKVYDLTGKGQIAAYGLRERVKAEPVRVRDAAGLREIPLASIAEEIGGRLSLAALARMSARGTLDLPSLTAPSTAANVAMLADAPRIERFVGRERELEAVTAGTEGPRVFVARGVAGIGKSSFGAKACELLRGRCNLYWHGVRAWDTRSSVLSGLGDFLGALGRPGLRAVLSRGDESAAPDVLREDLPGTHAFLVLDDAHQASPEVVQLLRFLKDIIEEAPDVRILVLTRQALPFYDRRDVAIRRIVREIDLGGLSPGEVASFLASGREVELTSLGRRVGGHPLFLELVRSAGRPSVPREALRNVERFIEEEIYSELSDAERTALKVASLYRVPVPATAILAAPASSHDVVLSLRNRALLRTAGEDALQVHDTIREFFAGILTPSEVEGLGRLARSQLRQLAATAQAEGNLVACIDYLSNALQLTPAGTERAAVREELGDVEERLGDLPAALTAYKEAVKEVEGAEARARLHRKMASAFIVREQKDTAATELEAGLQALGPERCVERGWLDLVRFGIAWREETWQEAQAAAEEALRTFQAFRDTAGQAQALLYLGKLQIDAPRGDLELSRRSFEEALRLAQSLRDVELEVKVRTGMAHLFGYRIGEVEAAQGHLAAIEGVAGTMRDPHARRAFLMLEGWFHLELLADCGAAEVYFSEARELGRKIHDASSISAARYGLAFCGYFRGRLDEACDQFEQLALADGMGSAADAAECLWMAAECCLRRGDLAGFDRVVVAFRAPRMAEGLAARPLHGLALKGMDRFLHGDRKGWRVAFEDALRIADQEGTAPDPALLCFLHFYYAIGLRVLGEESLAVQHLHQVDGLLRSQHLQARLQIMPVAERELSETLRRVAARA